MPAYPTFRTFLLIAPPIGWVIYALGVIAGEAVRGEPFLTLGAGLLVTLIGLPFSYLFGVPPAFLAALLFVVGSSRAGIEPGPVFATVVGLICGLAFALVFHRNVDAKELGTAGYVALKMVSCLVPTLICWWLARPKRGDGNETDNEAVRG